jgi:Fur family ferric uptake transcriptional regulator
LQAVGEARAAIPRLIASRGFRLTGPRRAVVEVVAGSEAPLTVADIHARLGRRRANLVSVYRAVHLLRDLALLRVADTSGGTKRYELAEQFTGHHHHLVCQSCGRVEDVAGCLFEPGALDALRRRVRRSRTFRVTDHDLKLFGVCAGCDIA